MGVKANAGLDVGYRVLLVAAIFGFGCLTGFLVSALSRDKVPAIHLYHNGATIAYHSDFPTYGLWLVEMGSLYALAENGEMDSLKGRLVFYYRTILKDAQCRLNVSPPQDRQAISDLIAAAQKGASLSGLADELEKQEADSHKPVNDDSLEWNHFGERGGG